MEEYPAGDLASAAREVRRVPCADPAALLSGRATDDADVVGLLVSFPASRGGGFLHALQLGLYSDLRGGY